MVRVVLLTKILNAIATRLLYAVARWILNDDGEEH